MLQVLRNLKVRVVLQQDRSFSYSGVLIEVDQIWVKLRTEEKDVFIPISAIESVFQLD